MKEIKREITKEQVVYEITKEELEAIKIEERNKGRVDVLDYFIFSIKNYKYKINLKGMQNLIENIVDFLNNKTNTIENIYGYSFHDYINSIKSDLIRR